MSGEGTAELQSFLPAELAAIFDDYGHDLVIVRPALDSARWGSLSHAATRSTVRGLLMPASQYTQRAAGGAGLPIPTYEAYLPYDASLQTPGWYIEHSGLRYTPTGDARDEGGQGVVLIVGLVSPGQVGNGPA